MSWRIEQSETEDLYELFGKAGKYRAQLENKTDKSITEKESALPKTEADNKDKK